MKKYIIPAIFVIAFGIFGGVSFAYAALTVDLKSGASNPDGPITIPYNSSEMMSWTSTGATSCTASASPYSTKWTGQFPTTWAMSTGGLTSSRTFYVNCTDGYRTVSDSVTVNVVAPLVIQSPGFSGPYTSGDNMYISWTPALTDIYTIELIPTDGHIPSYRVFSKSTAPGEIDNTTGSLNYKIPDNVKSGKYNIRIMHSGVNFVFSGTFSIQAPEPTTPLTVDLKSGASNPDGPITIPYNSSEMMSWTSTGATSCTASASPYSTKWTGQFPTTWAMSTGGLTETTAFIVSCTNGINTVSDSVTVNVYRLVVNSPQFGGLYTAGKDVYVSWNPAYLGVSEIQLIPSDDHVPFYLIYTSKDNGGTANTKGNLSFPLPILGEKGYIKPGKYEVKIFPADGSSSATSNVFSIISSQEEPIPDPLPLRGKLHALPNPCVVSAGNARCKSTLTWSTQGSSKAKIVKTDGWSTIFYGTSGSGMVESGYEYRLYDYSSSGKDVLLASVFIQGSLIVTPGVSDPQITSISPSSARAGDTVTIYGVNFDNSVYVEVVGEQSIPTSSYTNTSLQFVIPPSLTVGPHVLLVSKKAGRSSVNAILFNVTSDTSNTTTIITSPKFGGVYNVGGSMRISWTPILRNIYEIRFIPSDGHTSYYKIDGPRMFENLSTNEGWLVLRLPKYGEKGYVKPGKYEVKIISNDGSPTAVSNVFSINGLGYINPSYPTIPTLLTRNIWRGLRGSDVKKLQQLLNSNPNTRIAESGAGSPGNETDYFGFITQFAVQNFQCKHGIVCSGTPNSTGYGVVGPKTRIKLQEVFNRNTGTEIFESSSSSVTDSHTKYKASLQQQIEQALEQIKLLQQQINAL